MWHSLWFWCSLTHIVVVPLSGAMTTPANALSRTKWSLSTWWTPILAKCLLIHQKNIQVKMSCTRLIKLVKMSASIIDFLNAITPTDATPSRGRHCFSISYVCCLFNSYKECESVYLRVLWLMYLFFKNNSPLYIDDLLSLSLSLSLYIYIYIYI